MSANLYFTHTFSFLPLSFSPAQTGGNTIISPCCGVWMKWSLISWPIRHEGKGSRLKVNIIDFCSGELACCHGRLRAKWKSQQKNGSIITFILNRWYSTESLSGINGIDRKCQAVREHVFHGMLNCRYNGDGQNEYS